MGGEGAQTPNIPYKGGGQGSKGEKISEGSFVWSYKHLIRITCHS